MICFGCVGLRSVLLVCFDYVDVICFWLFGSILLVSVHVVHLRVYLFGFVVLICFLFRSFGLMVSVCVAVVDAILFC